MGVFDELGKDFGVEDAALLKNGTLARGEIVSLTPTGVYRGGEGDQSAQSAVCDIVVDVIPLDGSPRYRATVRHLIAGISLPRLSDPGTAVALRVDPQDKTRIELDIDASAPDAPVLLTGAPLDAVLTGGDGSALPGAPVTVADVLKSGKDCTLRVTLAFPNGQNDSVGNPQSELMLAVHPESGADFTAQIGIHIPDQKAARVVVGASLPGKWIDDVAVPDWSRI